MKAVVPFDLSDPPPDNAQTSTLVVPSDDGLLDHRLATVYIDEYLLAVSLL